MKKLDFNSVSAFYDVFMRYWNVYKVKEELSLLKLNKDHVILDIGAGTGYYSKYFSKYCKEITLIDKSNKMLKKARQCKNMKIVNSDIFKHDFKDKKFDRIIVNDVFHHINDQEKFILLLNNLLKSNGKILIYDFDYSNFFAKILCIFEKMIFQDINYITFYKMRTLVKKYGFKIEKKILDKHYFMLILTK